MLGVRDGDGDASERSVRTRGADRGWGGGWERVRSVQWVREHAGVSGGVGGGAVRGVRDGDAERGRDERERSELARELRSDRRRGSHEREHGRGGESTDAHVGWTSCIERLRGHSPRAERV